MIESLSTVEQSIVDVKTQIESLDNELLNLHYEALEKIQDNFNNLHSEIDNIIGLFEDLDVATKDNNWTTEGLTQLALLSEKYELAKYQSESYGSAIERLNQEYLSGKYSLLEYQEKLSDLTEKQWDAINTAENAKESILSLNEARVNIVVDGINEEIDAYKELIDQQLELIDATEELSKKRDTLQEKSKKVTDLERQIAAMMGDTTASTVAKRKKLEEELVEAKKDLADTEHDYSIDSQRDALNKQYEDYEKTRNDEITALQDSLKNQEQIIADSFETVKKNASLVGQQITQIAQEHGVKVSESLISSWKQGENAIASYGEELTVKSSAFIENIAGVENEVWNLQYQANDTANSLAWMFSTQADNLVNELAQSYYAEGNLYNMTNALQNSLVDTLERGYNVSSITSALNAIENAAQRAADAIRSVNDTPVNTTPVNTSTNSQSRYTVNQNARNGQYEIIDTTTNKVVSTHRTEKAVNNALARLPRYATGVHNLKKDELAYTQDGGEEIILSPSRDGILTPLKAGDSVLTKAQTDNIFDWSNINPNILIPQSVRDFAYNMPQVVNRNINQPVSVHYDSFLTVNGDINDVSHFVGQVEQIATKVAVKEDTKNAKKILSAISH